ncbi:MAG: hypothetical protein DRP11_04550 [Candidatus Aenigmatarchaeota archaeon]|nr:MAG: hypothetical protein DRP11_04550 [Candidatus Aenigmarchaeota archaeon]
MPILKGFLGKRDETFDEDEFLEVDVDLSHEAGTRVPIKIVRLNEYNDAERIQKAVREGNIVLVKIKTLKERDMTELKRAIERLRKTTTAINGDIVGVDEDYVIVTPSYAHVHRSEAE